MSKPAARTGDMHSCPMVTGTVPHVGGPILPPLAPDGTVLIGGLPAARATDQASCTGPIDIIVVGSSSVLIGGKMAARIGDPTMHGGQILPPGCPTVLIGGPSAGATLGNPEFAKQIFPGQQKYGNCGVQSTQQIISAALAKYIPEDDLLKFAIANGWADDDPDPDNKGATNSDQQESILNNLGVPSHQVPNTMTEIAQAVAERRGVISGHDAGLLWNDPESEGYGHSVLVTGVEYDKNGNIQYVRINDTGIGGCLTIPANQFEKSLLPDDTAVVTDDPIW